MTREIMVKVHPIDVADRIRKMAHDATDENRHTDAFLLELAADTINQLCRVEGSE